MKAKMNRAKRRAAARRIVARAIERVLNNERAEAWYVKEYGEPGYSDPKAGVFVGNWNNVDGATQATLEEAGFEFEWCDEWVEHNGKAYRCQADGPGWEPSLIISGEGDFYVVGEDDEEIIDLRAMTDKNGTPNVVPSAITEEILESFGYIKEPDEVFESGWFNGQTDDPKKIAEHLWKDPRVEAVVFRMKEVSMFYIKFESYVKRREGEEQEEAA